MLTRNYGVTGLRSKSCAAFWGRHWAGLCFKLKWTRFSDKNSECPGFPGRTFRNAPGVSMFAGRGGKGGQAKTPKQFIFNGVFQPEGSLWEAGVGMAGNRQEAVSLKEQIGYTGIGTLLFSCEYRFGLKKSEPTEKHCPLNPHERN